MVKISSYVRTDSNYDKPVNVRFVLYHKGRRYYYTSQITVYPSQWNSTEGLVGGNNRISNSQFRDVNQKIIEIYDIISEVWANRNPFEEINSDWLKEKVDFELTKRMSVDVLSSKPFSCFIEEYMINHVMDKRRKQAFNIIHSTFVSFEKYMSILKGRRIVITYNSLDHNTLNKYLDFLKKEADIFENHPEIYEGRNIKKVNKRCKDTSGEYLKKLRCVVNYVRESTGTTNYPFLNYRIKTAKYGTPIVLRQDEIKRIYDFKTTNKTYMLIRDNFLLQLSLACRVDDFFRLKYNDILLTTDEKTGQLINYLTFTPQKTMNSSCKQVSIPLTDLAREIIYKYKGQSQFLIPHYTDTYYNRKLKELFQVIGLDRIVSVLDKTEQRDIQTELWTKASSHLSRRTTISFLHNKGCKTEMIDDISGHVNNTVESRYMIYDLSSKLEYLNQLCDWVDEAEMFDPRKDLVFKVEPSEEYNLIPFIPMQQVI